MRILLSAAVCFLGMVDVEAFAGSSSFAIRSQACGVFPSTVLQMSKEEEHTLALKTKPVQLKQKDKTKRKEEGEETRWKEEKEVQRQERKTSMDAVASHARRDCSGQ